MGSDPCRRQTSADVPVTRHPAGGTRRAAPGTRYPAPGTRHPAGGGLPGTLILQPPLQIAPYRTIYAQGQLEIVIFRKTRAWQG